MKGVIILLDDASKEACGEQDQQNSQTVVDRLSPPHPRAATQPAPLSDFPSLELLDYRAGCGCKSVTVDVTEVLQGVGQPGEASTEGCGATNRCGAPRDPAPPHLPLVKSG